MYANVETCRWLPSRALTVGRVGLMPACVLLVLAGLFGMHGLADHGMWMDSEASDSISAPGAVEKTVAHHSMAGEPSTGPRASEGNLSARLLGAPSPVPSHATTPSALDSMHLSTLERALGTSHHGPENNMAAGLCLARTLVGLLLGLAAWLLAIPRPALSEHLQWHIRIPRPRGRDPDPPSLAVLSVWRC